MERLPEELIAAICDHCDHASLKNARAVDHRLLAASTPGVFRHFYMGLFEHSLAHLEKLAKSPIRKHVKKLTIWSDVLPNFTKDAWFKIIDQRPTYSEWMAPYRTADAGLGAREAKAQRVKDYEKLIRRNLTEEQVEQGYAAYLKAVSSQLHWRQYRLMLPFQEYFSMLPNLVEASVKCTTPFAGRRNDWPVWKSLRRSMLVDPDNWLYNTDCQEENYAYLSGHAAVSLLAAVGHRASYADKSEIKSLTVHSSHLDSYRKLLMDARALPELPHMNAIRAYGILDGFVNLTNLHLHVPHATLSSRLGGNSTGSEIMEMLECSRNLQRLDLRYGDDELSPDDDVEQIEALFIRGGSELIWPKIEHLALATNIAGQILIEFIRKHACTLKSLELRDMLIHDVDSAMEQIPRVTTLQHVYMECLWTDADQDSSMDFICVFSRGTDFDDRYEKAVKKYLLGRSDALPKIKRDGGLSTVEDWNNDDLDMADTSEDED
ncbi:hypothetical protein DOTSEDRAFT_40511 [Dothistroma septosporum NZE10]|uniref:F-box domain-containing protein n=1 Tax=Dothistroma septosporum (strain NZE10 / CBS 128990) TaxID=675120 RepID=N1Q0S0_DOTSN|nr:hypothetical protein DOTSEDRAFT_40511 [Dothistroma septosporum NZE10]